MRALTLWCLALLALALAVRSGSAQDAGAFTPVVFERDGDAGGMKTTIMKIALVSEKDADIATADGKVEHVTWSLHRGPIARFLRADKTVVLLRLEDWGGIAWANQKAFAVT